MQRKSEFGTILGYILLVFLCVGFAVLMYLNVRANKDLAEQRKAEIYASLVTATPAPTEEPAPTPTPVRNAADISLVFGGDMIGQVGLTTEARKAGGVIEEEMQDAEPEAEDEDEEIAAEPVVRYAYDYTPQLAPIAERLSEANLAACSLTGVLMEADEYESYQLAPSFAEALSVSGIDLVNTATSHALDFGFDNLCATVNAVGANAMTNIGTFADEESFNLVNGIVTKVIDGVSFAFLSYTWETNDISAANNPYAVNILTTDYMSGKSEVDYDRLASDLARARELGANFIVTYICWSSNDSYYSDVREDQSAVVDYLCENGADIVIGGGLKVPQPIELRDVTDDKGEAKKCVVAYGLGNMLNCMNDANTNLSALLSVGLKHDLDTGEIWIDTVCYRPLFVLDTDDYDDIDHDAAPFKYRIFDIYDTVELFDAVNTGRGEIGDSEYIADNCITRSVYDAMRAGAESLKGILGAEYDIHNGGVSLLG